MLCNSVDINIADSLSKRFIEKRDVLEILSKNKKLPLGSPVSGINTNEIEKLVLANSLVKACNVYATIDGKINIELWQREPVVRIIDKRNKSYYLDSEGSVIKMSERFTPHILVVTGNINTPFSHKSIENIYNRKYNGKAEKLREIHEMAMFISHDEFWDSQIVQMYVDKNGEFEIVPRIGPHLILLGKKENYKKKFKKLWVFYKEGLNNVGWNQYLKINLKYKDQIVCTKI